MKANDHNLGLVTPKRMIHRCDAGVAIFVLGNCDVRFSVVATLAVAILLSAGATAATAQVYVGEPFNWYDRSANHGTCIPYGCDGNTENVVLYQQVYAGLPFFHFNALLFFSAETGIRIDAQHGGFFYTSRDVGDLSDNPAENILRPLETRKTGQFGYIYDLQFGNLLYQGPVHGQDVDPGLALIDDPQTSRLWVLKDGTVHQDNVGLVTRFNVVPEPETWMLLLLGFGMIGTALRQDKSRSLELARQIMLLRFP